MITAVAFDSCTRTADAVARHADLHVGAGACGKGQRAAGHLGWSVHLGAVDGEQPVGAAGPDLHRPVVGVADPDPDPLAGFRCHIQILGLAVDGPHATVGVRDR